MDKKRIFKDYVVFSAGNYISQIFGAISAFLLRAFLVPYYMGIWQGLNIIKSYTSYTNLGVSRSAAREIAYFRGKGDEERAEALKDVGFSFSLIMIILVGIGCIVYAFLSKGEVNVYLFWGFIAVGVIVILERVESYIVTILRSKKKFAIESVWKIVNSIIQVALIFFIVKNFKLYGLYAVNIIVFSLSIILLLNLSKERFRFFLSKQDLKHLIKIGIPLVLYGVMYISLTNIDKIVILKMLGLESLGFYSIALMVGNLVHSISKMGGIVLYPRFQEKYGKNDDKMEIYVTMCKILKILLMPLTILIGGLFFFLPYIIEMFIPKYAFGIVAMKIFMFGMFFLSLAIFCNHFLITINKQFYSLGICIGAILLNLVLSISFVKVGFGIEGVAAATSISYVVYFFALLLASKLCVQR